MYKKYKNARDMAWKMLIKHQVSALPVNILALCREEKLTVFSYSEASRIGLLPLFEEIWQGTDGFSVIVRGRKLILYRDDCIVTRARFTIAHELGHYALGDVSSTPTKRNFEPTEEDDDIETAANMFAARILSPACVLRALNVTKAEQIARLCGVSMAAAKWRCKRLLALYEREQEWLATRGRSCFFISPLEVQVFRQFKPFIEMC